MNIRSTTIIAVRRFDQVALAGDDRSHLEKTIVKHGATKVRTLSDGKILADLRVRRRRDHAVEMFERKLKDHSNQLVRPRSKWDRSGALTVI